MGTGQVQGQGQQESVPESQDWNPGFQSRSHCQSII